MNLYEVNCNIGAITSKIMSKVTHRDMLLKAIETTLMKMSSLQPSDLALKIANDIVDFAMYINGSYYINIKHNDIDDSAFIKITLLNGSLFDSQTAKVPAKVRFVIEFMKEMDDELIKLVIHNQLAAEELDDIYSEITAQINKLIDIENGLFCESKIFIEEQTTEYLEDNLPQHLSQFKKALANTILSRYEDLMAMNMFKTAKMVNPSHWR